MKLAAALLSASHGAELLGTCATNFDECQRVTITSTGCFDREDATMEATNAELEGDFDGLTLFAGQDGFVSTSLSVTEIKDGTAGAAPDVNIVDSKGTEGVDDFWFRFDFADTIIVCGTFTTVFEEQPGEPTLDEAAWTTKVNDEFSASLTNANVTETAISAGLISQFTSTTSISTTSTTATTTSEIIITTTPITTAVCWTCKEASSFDECATNGSFQSCQINEDVCMLELRRYGDRKRITTGCMSESTCESLKKQSFNGPFLWKTQCRTENARLWNRRHGESTCRNCFSNCDSSDTSSCYKPQSAQEEDESRKGIPLWVNKESESGTKDTYWNPLTVTDRNEWKISLKQRQKNNLRNRLLSMRRLHPLWRG